MLQGAMFYYVPPISTCSKSSSSFKQLLKLEIGKQAYSFPAHAAEIGHSKERNWNSFFLWIDHRNFY